MAPRRKVRKIHRSAITGHFVKAGYAKRHPNTSITESLKIGKRKEKG